MGVLLRDIYINDTGNEAKDKINVNFYQLKEEVDKVKGYHWAQVLYSTTAVVPLFPKMTSITLVGGYNLSALYVQPINGDGLWRRLEPNKKYEDIADMVRDFGMKIRITRQSLDGFATIYLVME